MQVLPQFPLHVVLFPTMVLPLHVFEPRYRSMIHDIIEADRLFGVVMIEKGRDTGGEDQRAGLGTVARLIEAEPFPDGRWAIVAVGVERYRISKWLPDNPYPLAQVELWPDEDDKPISTQELDRVATKFRRCLALASEAGIDVGEVPDRFDDPVLASMQMSAILPVGSFDKQKLLAVPGPFERLQQIEICIEETMELLSFKLQGDT